MSNDVKVPRLLTVKQLAEATGIPVWQIHELVRTEEAPVPADREDVPVRRGCRCDVDRGAVEHHAEGR